MPRPAHRQSCRTFVPRRCQQFRHTGELTGSHDDVYMGSAPEDVFLILLRHATEHTDSDLGLVLLDPLDPSQSAVDLVLGVLSDRAGIIKDGIGLLDVVRQLVTLLAQLGDHELAVQQVHLAAHRLDIELFLGSG